MQNRDLMIRQLGHRYCAVCYGKTRLFYSVIGDADSTQALKRDVLFCVNCGDLSIGEKLPQKALDWMAANGFDLIGADDYGRPQV